MNFSRRNKYILLVFLVILNIIFRIPEVPHEGGVDTFLIHIYTNIISSHGYANWIIHPLSIFGIYPFSYPSAVPFVQSGFSQSTGINIEYTILLTSIIIGLIGMFTSYFMAKEMKDDDLFAFSVAFLFSLSPVFLCYTIATSSTRHLFIALVPLFIWGLLRCHNSPQSRFKYIILTVVLFISLGTIHHMVILLALVLIAYFSALILEHINIQIKINAFDKQIDLISVFMSLIWCGTYILCIALQVHQLYFYKKFNIWWKYQSGFFFQGIDAQSLFMNMLVDYWSKIGILAVLGLLGLVFVFKKPKRELYQNFLLITLLLFAPIITMGWYVPLVLLSFFCVLLVYGMLKLITHKKLQNFAPQLIIICLLMSVVFSIFMLWHWDTVMPGQKGNYLRDSECNLGAYLKGYGITGSSFVGHREARLSAVSELSLPPPYPTMFEFINESDFGINRSISLSSLLDLRNPKALYKPKIDYRFEYFNQPRDIDSDTRKQYDLKYNINYVVQELGIRGLYPKLFSTVSEKKPKIYDNGELSAWYIGTEI